MKRRLLFVFFGVVSFASIHAASAQSAEANAWFTPDAPATTAEKPAYATGWMSAPGTSLSLHDRPSTDYWGRPLKPKARRQKMPAAETETPAYATGWMSAPGMSLSLHNRPSTDYWGRPLKATARRKAASSLSAAPAETGAPVAVVMPRR